MHSKIHEEKILLLEDSPLLASTLRREMEKHMGCRVDLASTFQEASDLVQRTQDRYTLALLDLTLPDASQEDIVQFFRKSAIPSIVMTNKFDEALREYVFSQGVIDFILKDGPVSLEYLFYLLVRLHRNRDAKILLVDDSRSSREYMKRLLHKHNFPVLDASSGTEALTLLAQHQDICMAVIDYHMPGMDGYELTQKIRQQRDKDHLGILGVSAHGGNVLSARFLKVGANDFLSKPFLEEEFTCRVTRNVESLEHIQALEEFAIRDFLTGLHNRRFLRDAGTQLFAGLKSGKQTLCAATLDVDWFKKVNDTYGHDAGDAVLKKMGELLKKNVIQPDIVARVGGEEFCILLINRSRAVLEKFFEQLRTEVQNTPIIHNEISISITISIGVSIQEADTMNDLINQSDTALYVAKHSGRNRVVFHTPPPEEILCHA